MKRKAATLGSGKPPLKRQKTSMYNMSTSLAYRRRPVEKKYIDVSATTNSLNTTGVVQALNLVAVGDDNNNRDGRETQNVSVAIRGLIIPEDASTPNPTLVRVLLVWDQQPNGALATIANILQNATALSFNNLDNKKRFIILRDNQYAVGGIDNTATQAYAQSPTVHSIYEYVKLGPKYSSSWSGTTGVIGSLATGALLLVQIGTGAAGSGASLQAFTRVRFVG